MEVPVYFVVKFALAVVVALSLPLTFKLKTFAKAALAYTVLFTLLYYGVGLYVLRIPGLSVWSLLQRSELHCARRAGQPGRFRGDRGLRPLRSLPGRELHSQRRHPVLLVNSPGVGPSIITYVTN
jgi:hypothetical protein